MRSENRQEKTGRKKRRKKRYLLKFFILVLICTALYFILHIDFFNVQEITVTGNSYVSREEIIKLSGVKKGENLFDVHPMMTQHRIKKNLYIKDVDVDRKLHDRVEIHIEERSGKAQLLSKGKYYVTDNEGEVLDIKDKEQRITLVDNITVEKAEKGSDIRVRQEKRYERVMDMIAAMEENDLYFRKITLEGDKVRILIYGRLVCRGSYDDIMHSIGSDALRTVIYDLYQKDIGKGVINVNSNDYCSFTP